MEQEGSVAICDAITYIRIWDYSKVRLTYKKLFVAQFHFIPCLVSHSQLKVRNGPVAICDTITNIHVFSGLHVLL